MMKHLTYFLVLVAAVILSGCASDMARLSAWDGYAAFQKGNYKSAIENLKTAVSNEPANGDYQAWLGAAYYKAGRYKDAIVHLKKATELQPNNAYNVGSLGSAYRDNNQYREAIQSYMKAINLKPTCGECFSAIAYCQIKLAHYDEAITAAKRANELKPNYAVAYKNLGWAYGKKRQYDEAFKALRKSIELDPKYAFAYSKYGDFLAEKSDYAAAAEQYQKAASLKTVNLTYLSKLVGAYYKQGRYDDAIETANKAIGLSAINLRSYIFIEDNYPTVKAPTKLTPTLKAGLAAAKRVAIETGDRIIKINGQSTEGWSIEKAVKSIISPKGVNITIQRKGLDMPIEKVIKKESIILEEAATPLALRSLALIKKGKHEEAYKDIEKAYSLNSSDKWAQIALGAAHLDQGRYDESITFLSKVKENVGARIFEATAYAKKGDFNKAIEIYSTIPEEKLSPKDVPLWSDRTALLKTLKPFIASKMENAGGLKAQGLYKEALKELGDALKVSDDQESKAISSAISAIMEIDPKLSELPEEARKDALRGDVLTKQGKFEDAAKEYQRAIRAAPYIAKLYFNTAMICSEFKGYAQAIRSMKTYLQLAPEAPNARAVKDQIYKWEFMIEKGQ